MQTTAEYCPASDDHFALLCSQTDYSSSVFGPQVRQLCIGDMGAPLICHNGGKTYQLGVTIRDNQCQTDMPALYSDLRRYTGWFDTIIQRQNRPHVPPVTDVHVGPRPGRVEGNIQAETIGQTVNSFFGMVTSIFNYLDEED